MVVVKRQHIVITALVVLVGVAGYINWQYQDNQASEVISEDIIYNEQFEQTDDAQIAKKLGEAKYVSSNTDTLATDTDTLTTDYFSTTKLEYEAARSKSLEILTQTATNQNFDEKTRQNAQLQITQMSKNIETEAVIEGLLRAKGYESLVFINDDVATVTVKFDGLAESDIAKIKDIVITNSNIGKNIIVVEVK